jgi:hypothetical protein
MTPAERSRLIRTILDEQRKAIAAFHQASNAFGVAMRGTRQTLEALEDANREQGQAIARLVAANEATLDLFEGSPQ